MEEMGQHQPVSGSRTAEAVVEGLGSLIHSLLPAGLYHGALAFEKMGKPVKARCQKERVSRWWYSLGWVRQLP